MTDIPHFNTDEEMVEWFESANLNDYDLAEALEVQVATKLGLTLMDPWAFAENASTAGSVVEVETTGLTHVG